jgi:hypothetical protein
MASIRESRGGGGPVPGGGRGGGGGGRARRRAGGGPCRRRCDGSGACAGHVGALGRQVHVAPVLVQRRGAVGDAGAGATELRRHVRVRLGPLFRDQDPDARGLVDERLPADGDHAQVRQAVGRLVQGTGQYFARAPPHPAVAALEARAVQIAQQVGHLPDQCAQVPYLVRKIGQVGLARPVVAAGQSPDMGVQRERRRPQGEIRRLIHRAGPSVRAVRGGAAAAGGETVVDLPRARAARTWAGPPPWADGFAGAGCRPVEAWPQ